MKSAFLLQRSSSEKSSWTRIGAICCVCVSFAWEIVRDSPMVNIVSQTMNKHNSLLKIIRENAPWSSAAKSMFPGNAKWSIKKRYVTSLADTKHIFIDLWGIEFCSWLRPRAVSRLRARDEIIKSLRSEKIMRCICATRVFLGGKSRKKWRGQRHRVQKNCLL